MIEPHRPSRPFRAARARAAIAVACLALGVLAGASGCVGGAGGAQPETPVASDAAGASGAAPAEASSPEPSPGSTLVASVPATPPTLGPGFSVVILDSTRDDAGQVALLRDALERLLAGAEVTRIEATDPASEVGAVDAAFDAAPSLVIAIGPALLGAVDLASANRLATPVVLIGGQIAEPTANVSAIVWEGADGRAAIVGEDMPFGGAEAHADEAAAVAIDVYLRDELGLVWRLDD